VLDRGHSAKSEYIASGNSFLSHSLTIAPPHPRPAAPLPSTAATPLPSAAAAPSPMPTPGRRARALAHAHAWPPCPRPHPPSTRRRCRALALARPPRPRPRHRLPVSQPAAPSTPRARPPRRARCPLPRPPHAPSLFSAAVVPSTLRAPSTPLASARALPALGHRMPSSPRRQCARGRPPTPAPRRLARDPLSHPRPNLQGDCLLPFCDIVIKKIYVLRV
jgi:hypothetical protein